jgi:hypothetical protein
VNGARVGELSAGSVIEKYAEPISERGIRDVADRAIADLRLWNGEQDRGVYE